LGLALEIKVQQWKSFEAVAQRNVRNTARVFGGAYRQHEVLEQHVVASIGSSRPKADLAIDLSDAQRGITFAVYAEKNMWVLRSEPLNARPQPEVGEI
jgi:hypothetical protein